MNKPFKLNISERLKFYKYAYNQLFYHKIKYICVVLIKQYPVLENKENDFFKIIPEIWKRRTISARICIWFYNKNERLNALFEASNELIVKLKKNKKKYKFGVITNHKKV